MEEFLIKYDDDFLKTHKKLAEILDAGDLKEINTFILENYQKYFKIGRALAGKSLADVSEEDRKELMRPLSTRQMRMVETLFLCQELEGALYAYWDFFDDYERIGQKRLMSIAELGVLPIMTERMLVLTTK